MCTFDTRRRLFATVVVLLVLSGCGDAKDDPVAPDGTPTSLAVTPATGAVGSLVEITGLDATAFDPDALEVRFGESVAVARVDTSGAIVTAVPILLAPDGSLVDPSGAPLDVHVRVDGATLATAEAAFTVTALPEAPGTAVAVAAAFTSIVDDVEAVARALAPTPSVEDGYATALFEATRALIDDPERGLVAQIDSLGTDAPEVLAVLDGVLASSGALERLEAAAAELDALVLDDSPELPLLRRTTELTDHELAARMQLYVMVRDVGRDVIGGAVQDWGSWIGPVFGGISLVGVSGPVAAPVVAAMGTFGVALGVINTAVNNVALAHLPANVDRFELRVLAPTVAPGAVADTEIWIEASNNPSTLTTLDITDMVLTVMGFRLPRVPTGHPVRNALLQTIDYYLGIARARLSAYAARHPGSDFSFDLGGVPAMTWSARVDDTRYVTPLSFTPEIIDANGFDVLAWRAALDGRGEGRIYARINNGPEVTSLVQIPGVTYTSGAFGDDVLTSETQTVVVQPEFTVSASMASEISPVGANALEVVAGYADGEGGIDGESGIQIQLVATGGTVDESSGTTDDDGSFITLARLSEASSSITVEVTATDSLGNTATTSVAAGAGELLRNVSRHTFVSARTRIDFEPIGGADYDCDDADDGSYDGLGPHTDTRTSSCSASHEDGSLNLTADSDQTSDVQLRSEDPSLDVLLRATGTGTTENVYEQEGNPPGRSPSTSRTFFRLDFEVGDTPLQIDYDCLSQISRPYPGGYGSVYLLGPDGEYVFRSRTNSTFGGGAIERGSMVLESGSYVFAIDLFSKGSLSDTPKKFEFELEIKVPDTP